MARVLEGQLSASGLRFAIIVSRFNSFITERLLGGAMDALTRTGANPDEVDLVKVPGSWEVPVVAGELARQKRYDAIICLAAVIRGDTPHFDYVAGEAARGIQQVALQTAVPVIFGVLTTNTEEQARARIDESSPHGHAGRRAAEAAVEMIALRNQIQGKT